VALGRVVGLELIVSSQITHSCPELLIAALQDPDYPHVPYRNGLRPRSRCSGTQYASGCCRKASILRAAAVPQADRHTGRVPAETYVAYGTTNGRVAAYGWWVPHPSTSPSHDHHGMCSRSGTSSADRWYRDIVVTVVQAK
jgi:hypothetical protein